MNEKAALERYAVIEFATLFSAEAGRGKLEFVAQLDPPSPDVHCQLDGEDLFVEVAHVYGTESDAKKSLGRSVSSLSESFSGSGDSVIEFGERIIGQLNRVLENKAGKDYDKRPVWLVIRSAFPLMDLDDFQFYKDRIQVPAESVFAEIWLLCGKSASAGALRLA